MAAAVIVQHFTRAQMDASKTEAFIHAAHKCESLMDKAMLDGRNIPRQTFLDHCKAVIGESRHTRRLLIRACISHSKVYRP